jgi:hypothetical protein
VFSIESDPRLHNESLFEILRSPVVQLETECPVEEDDSVQSDSDLSTVVTKLYKSPINSIIKSKTRLFNHANPGYVTIF